MRLGVSGQSGSLFAIALLATLCSSPVAAMAPSSSIPQGDPEFRAYRATLTQYFRTLNVLPIILSVGEDIGSAFDVGTWTLLSRGDECFDTGRMQARSTQQNLPDLTLRRASDVKFQAGLSSVATAQALGDSDVTATLKFRDVTVMSVSSQTLRDAYRDACPSLKPILDGSLTPADRQRPLTAIIGTLVFARVELRIAATNNARANAAVSDLRAAIRSVAGEAVAARWNVGELRGEAGAGAQGGAEFSMTEDRPRPVAFAPAFLPRLVFREFRGEQAQGAVVTNELAGIQWRDFDAADPGTVAELRRLSTELEAVILNRGAR